MLLDACPLCIANRKGRGNHKGHFGYRKHQTKTVPIWERTVKRPEQTVEGTASDRPDRGHALAQTNHLWAFLTDSVWDDGKPRERATLLVLMDGGLVKLWLNDRAMNRNAWMTGTTLEEAFDNLDDCLGNDSCPWKPSKKGGDNPPRRR